MRIKKIAALFVYSDGPYSRLPGVEVWGIEHDARRYAGEKPVIAHPPCARWCQMAAFVEKTHGHKRGDDGGCFASALANVRRVGGVLEHPAYSRAFSAHDLPRPSRFGGWQRGLCGGWVCQVDQRHYGHKVNKPTWLYAFGCDLPELRWGEADRADFKMMPLGALNRDGTVNRDPRPTLSQRERSATPEQFRELLVSMARSAVARPQVFRDVT